MVTPEVSSMCVRESKDEKSLAEEVGFEPTCPAHHRTTRFRVGPGTSTSVLLRRSLEPIRRFQVKERSPLLAGLVTATVTVREHSGLCIDELTAWRQEEGTNDLLGLALKIRAQVRVTLRKVWFSLSEVSPEPTAPDTRSSRPLARNPGE